MRLFDDPPRRSLPEPLLPMINVVFLLLIFFLLAATLARPAPFAVTPPEASGEGEADAAGLTLFVGADGELGFGSTRGEGALAAFGAAAQEARAQCGDCADRLTLRADAALSGETLARLMPELGGLGFTSLDLVVRGK
ncbi:ExbD/TolR family protein [Thioclava atlantica]|uniref:ExbD/TolR family protein n=1 Tax=Thioclava atlantica TaxID=1317124 RepID=UPI00056E31EF|nr:biopolymer transporter ExbD [Thioclava atlantica]